VLGTTLCLLGVAVIMYVPRTGYEQPPPSRPGRTTVIEVNKTIVRRLVDEVFNGGHLEVLDELYAPELAGGTRRWIAPFRDSFPDVHMEIVELIAEGDKVVAASPARPPPGGMARAGPDRAPLRAGR
jgi:hypothetical protein